MPSESLKQPIGQLPPQPWLHNAETRKLLCALEADGDEVRFVGGCVRDSVMLKDVSDIDLATTARPERVMKLLRRAGIKVIPTGLKHGTVTAVINRTPYEITTLRRDVTTDGRHAHVAFTDDWQEDAARRDFTINALSCTPDGAIYDYFDGLADLGRGLVRFVGIPKKRIEEDILRLLRFFRFYAFYGSPPIDVDSLAACRAAAPGLVHLSAERISAELFKILSSPDPASVLLLMHSERILPHILPEASDFGRLRLMAWLETRGLVMDTVMVDPLRRLAALIDVTAEEARALARRLRLSNAQGRRLSRLCNPDFIPVHTLPSSEIQRHLQHVGAAEFRDLVLLAWCGRKSVQARPEPDETAHWTEMLRVAEVWQPVVFPLTGMDLISAGVPPGEDVGILLHDIRQWWEDGGYQAGYDLALAELHRRLALSPTDQEK